MDCIQHVTEYSGRGQDIVSIHTNRLEQCWQNTMPKYSGITGAGIAIHEQGVTGLAKRNTHREKMRR